jgi:hypothetical protein
MAILEIIQSNLLTPIVLFFIFGMVAAIIKSKVLASIKKLEDKL